MTEPAPHILVVEDEAALAELIRYNLAAGGLRATITGSGKEAELLVAEEAFDLVVLDWMLPRHVGAGIMPPAEEARGHRNHPHPHAHRPRRGGRPRARALHRRRRLRGEALLGAGILARVKALLRRAVPQRMADTLQRGDIVLDRAAHRVTRREREVRLGPTEYKLLLYFMENTGRVLTREQLLDGVWGRDAFIDGRTVDVHVGRLRKALIRGADVDPIRTVRGTGYAFDTGAA